MIDCEQDNKPSFFQEYNWKLKHVYDKFFTDRAKEIAEKRRKASIDFFENMYNEVYTTHENGKILLKEALTNK